MVWIQFIAAGAVIVISGTLLTTHADRLSDKLGISNAIVGLFLLSLVTSLPELGTTVSVVASVGKPDLAAGNIFGSNAFNILIVAIMDLSVGSASIYALSHVSHKKSALLAMLMTAVAILAIRFGGAELFGGRIGTETLLLLALYVGGIYSIFKGEKESGHPHADKKTEKESVTREVTVIAVSAVFVVLAGYWLASISDEIARVTGWGETFVGGIFLAVTTSLPELVISLTAIRLKAYDMAVANIFGSCFFNILMFSIADPFYGAPLLQNVSNIRLAVVSFVMIGVAGTAFACGRRGYGGNFSFVKWVIIALYLLGSYVAF